jgi:hypothetical protein
MGPIHVASRSGLQSSVSTNIQPGAREKVRLLLLSCQLCRKRTMTITNLTSPLPSADTPLQPSRPLVHATRSPLLKFALLQPSPSVAHLSFSHNSTVRISERQCRSSSLSSSRRRVSRVRSVFDESGVVCVRAGRMYVRVNGWVRRKGMSPSMRKVRRKGKRNSRGDKRMVSVRRVKRCGVYGEECVR